MKLQDLVTLVFKNDEGVVKNLEITVAKLIDGSLDEFYDLLEESEPCTSSSCNNESQNFCDCPEKFLGFELVELTFNK
jgi:hypothetical protein